jgi:tetrathionate reductase subunit B
MNQTPSRREFFGQSSAVLAAMGISVTETGEAAEAESPDSSSKFRPEEFWKERMTPPDDGRKYGWFIDSRRCFGCHACEVSCKAENDVPLGNYIRQTIYKDVGSYPKVARLFLPMACQHCEDAPCVKACPCGALHKADGGTVAIDYDVCSGHGTCVEVCPYGAIYLDPVAKQAVKCHNCLHRIEHDLEPACVPTCPSEALYFGDLNDANSKISVAMREAEAAALGVTQLRAEKGTKPRMWFTGQAPVEIEERVPREGQSYSPKAYDVYQWKEAEG